MRDAREWHQWPPVQKKTKRPDRPKFQAEIKIEESDWIDAIEYDPETFVLDAKLLNGNRYRYRDVSPLAFSRVVTARSSGQAFNAEIRPLRCTKLPTRSTKSS